jgi:hypothetical protein
MPEADMLEIARKMRGPGGTGRVLVLDVDYSSRKHGIELGARANRHAYYLRPTAGMKAADLERILDEAGGEEELAFHYYVYPELQTDLKPLLSADPFAGKNFERDDRRKLLQIEGERPKARDAIAKLLDGLKEPFKPGDFPRIHEFVLSSFKPSSEGKWAEMVLHRRDGERNALRRAEPGFHIALAEHGFAREIEIHRPMVAEADPVIIISSNDHTGELGHKFISDLAAYFGSQAYAEGARLADREAAEKKTGSPSGVQVSVPSAHIARAPDIQPTKLGEQQLVAKVAAGLKELVPGMKLLRKREVSRRGPYVTMQFPGVLGFGKGPSPKEIEELESVFRALRGDPSFGSGWRIHYQVDGKSGEVRIATSFDAPSSKDWTTL